jgi:hypothetical protein
MTFADVLASSGISVLDLAENYAELSETLRKEVVSRIDDEFGLEIPQLYIVNVSVPAEVERALDAQSSMNAIGDMNAFQAYQLANLMSEAAANPAGGLDGAGVGLGMGLAMTNSMGGIVAPSGGGGSGSSESAVCRSAAATHDGLAYRRRRPIRRPVYAGSVGSGGRVGANQRRYLGLDGRDERVVRCFGSRRDIASLRPTATTAPGRRLEA